MNILKIKHNGKVYTRSDSKMFGGGLDPISAELFTTRVEKKYMGDALVVIEKKGIASYKKILKFDYPNAKQFYNSLS